MVVLCGDSGEGEGGTTWSDEGYVKSLAFVLDGRLAGTYHISKNGKINN